MINTNNEETLTTLTIMKHQITTKDMDYEVFTRLASSSNKDGGLKTLNMLVNPAKNKVRYIVLFNRIEVYVGFDLEDAIEAYNK